jgi:hypothetical protein
MTDNQSHKYIHYFDFDTLELLHLPNTDLPNIDDVKKIRKYKYSANCIYKK